MDFDDRIFDTTEKRLDKLNGLKAKHGGSLDYVKEALITSKEKLDFYKEYEDNLKLAEEAYIFPCPALWRGAALQNRSFRRKEPPHRQAVRLSSP